MVRILTQILLGLALAAVGFMVAIGLHYRSIIMQSDVQYQRQRLTASQEKVLHSSYPLWQRCGFALQRTMDRNEHQDHLVRIFRFYAAYPVVCYGTPDDVLDRAYFADSYIRGWGKPGPVYDTIAPRVISDLSDDEFVCLLRSTRSGRAVCGPDKSSETPD